MRSQNQIPGFLLQVKTFSLSCHYYVWYATSFTSRFLQATTGLFRTKQRDCYWQHKEFLNVHNNERSFSSKGFQPAELKISIGITGLIVVGQHREDIAEGIISRWFCYAPSHRLVFRDCAQLMSTSCLTVMLPSESPRSTS
jgi:hypothetical protein